MNPATHSTDWRLLEKLIPFADFMRNYHHYKVVGLEKIPKKGSAMILVNHSLATYDILLLGYLIFAETGRLPRGLADSNFYKNTAIASWMERLGVYEASPVNAQQLLEEGELLILAPGGTKEAIRSSDEKYVIKWDDRSGFARLAIKTQTPVILAACPKADDLYTVKDSPLTKLAYKFFKFPFPFANGLGNTLIPKPLNLVHYLEGPFSPPLEETTQEEGIISFKNYLQQQMQELLDVHAPKIKK